MAGLSWCWCVLAESAAEVGSTRSAVGPHQTHRSFVNSYETAPNARHTTQTERRWAGNSRPALRLDPQLEHKPPIGRPLAVKFFICQLQAHPATRSKPAMAELARTTMTRGTLRSSAAQLRAPPHVPDFTFPDEPFHVRRTFSCPKSRSTDDRGSTSASFASVVDSEVQSRPRSSRTRPRTRGHEAHLTSNVDDGASLGFIITKFVPHHFHVARKS